jgi:hypothetical protein
MFEITFFLQARHENFLSLWFEQTNASIMGDDAIRATKGIPNTKCNATNITMISKDNVVTM